ncbi:MAG: HEAT repeat domain-containing protein, partial [Flavobacteriaceae bacterium]
MIESLYIFNWPLLSLPEIHTDLLWYLTFAFCGLGIVYLVFVFFFRNRLSRKASLVVAKKKELTPMISQFLFFEESASIDERKNYLSGKVEMRELIKSEFNRSVLSEILMDLQKDVSGEARQNLYELYKNLGLHHDAYAKLKSRRWEIISQGILELTQMRVEDSYMFIRRFINHRKGVIRKQAQLATVTLEHEGISYFLDTCRRGISEWQQLKLLDVLRHKEAFNPPRFKIWLTSKNKDVVLFSLRLIRYYKQNDANQAIIQLIKHRNSQIKTEAVQCLKEFGVTEALDTLKLSFRKCNNDVKIAVLDAIADLGSEEDIKFLKKVEHSDDNFMVRSKALTAINTIDPDSIMPKEDIREPNAADLRFAESSEPSEISEAPNENPTEEINEEMTNQQDEMNIGDHEEE